MITKIIEVRCAKKFHPTVIITTTKYGIDLNQSKNKANC